MLIKAEVISGRSLGRKIGFPTANIALSEDIEIENGVYCTTIRVNGKEYQGVSNVGVKPTVGAAERGLECHILDFQGDLYGQKIAIQLHEKIRDEKRFATLDELKCQIEADIEKIRKLK
ncbi:MAG: riboflavin kinase [Rikenellaceae bacterium]